MAEVVCGVMYSVCLCGEPPGHDPPHRCCRRSVLTDDGRCKGAWEDNPEGGAPIIRRYPTGETDEAEARARAAEIASRRVDDVLADLPRLGQIKRGGIKFQ